MRSPDARYDDTPPPPPLNPAALDVWAGTYSGSWQDDTGSITAMGSPVVVSGPFYITELNGAPPNSPYNSVGPGCAAPATKAG